MSKRVNNIFKNKIKFENMLAAYKRAAKGKKQNKEVILFQKSNSNLGIPIGGVISPVLANLFLHTGLITPPWGVPAVLFTIVPSCAIALYI